MDGKKRICLVYEFLSEQGGLEREIISHARMLIDYGYDVRILTCHLNKEILKLLPFEGLKIDEISRIKTPFEWVNIALCMIGLNKLSHYNPDAFLTYSAPSNFLLRNKRARRINYINHYPHFLYLKGKEKLEWARGTQGVKRWISLVLSSLLGSYLKKADKRLVRTNILNFTNSNFTKKRIDEIYKINSVVSYPPLDSKFLKLPKNKIKEKFIFSSSRIIPDKKYEWLISACALMKNKIPLYIAGSVKDNYKSELLNLARNKNVRLIFLGRLDTEKIKEYYASAEVFAFPTPEEDFGLVPAESLACGTPVIAWGDGAGPTEQIVDGVNGYLAKPYQIKDFADKIDKAIESRIKTKNKKKIIKSSAKFSYPEIKKRFVYEIKKVLN